MKWADTQQGTGNGSVATAQTNKRLALLVTTTHKMSAVQSLIDDVDVEAVPSIVRRINRAAIDTPPAAGRPHAGLIDSGPIGAQATARGPLAQFFDGFCRRASDWHDILGRGDRRHVE